MNNWIEINQEEMKIGMNIAGLKKGELQIKYAKDIYNLQQKVEQLEKENNELKRKNRANNDLVPYFKNKIKEKTKKIKQLENIRKEAIEYIENNWITYNDSKDFTEFNEELPVFIKEINILLNILNKGNNKEK